MSDIVNEFNPSSDLVYTIEKNNEKLVDEMIVPTKDSYILKNITVPAKSKDTYKITFKFKDTNQNQNNQMSKTFRARIVIEAVRASNWEERGFNDERKY